MANTVVTLGDTSLTTDDLALLVPPAWFNDQLLSFWCEHIRLHILHGDSRVAILPPNISFFISLTNDDDDLQQIAAAHALPHKQLVLVTLNNSRQTDLHNDGPSGSHWSLLVFHRADNKLYHLDSMPSSRANLAVAKRLAPRLLRMLHANSAKLDALVAPTQRNSYDCGAFVCIFARAVIQQFKSGEPVAQLYSRGEDLTPDYVDATRQSIGKLASRIVNEQHNAANAQQQPQKPSARQQQQRKRQDTQQQGKQQQQQQQQRQQQKQQIQKQTATASPQPQSILHSSSTSETS